MSYDKEQILILIKTIKTMENKVKVWIARDECGAIFMHLEKPHKITDNVTGEVLGEWVSSSYGAFSKEFSSIKWEDDEPTEAYITLDEPQEQSQPKIDWEQRRYEIAKEMMAEIYRQAMEAQKYGQSVKRKDIVYYAVIFADMLIEKLKEKSE